ncbi:plasmid partitioning protein RepB [Epibacterium sp. SM1979]|uniref:Plasmid partitioning protein RepB n=1 Tax=Tritonibacter litoralis TaxID=2662264 RepID=A0A843YFG9_9RHOB|nr:plasmid partitioning protein RepB [Tritonibacter litoralis]MQQ09631.1 plasmid partitioning protein RepB [Tritonibacter litoralis]
MARKNLLKGLMDQSAAPETPPAQTRVDVAKPRYSSGAIGAVSQSISDLKSRAVQEIDPRMIDAGGIRDRLDEDGGLLELIASIEEYGQQVPVLLRPNPNYPERYQVVYGRRRVAALRRLERPVKALIRVLDDRELIVAQGQENSARRDLSFIERVNFARQMRQMGYERKVICDALHVDKTLISRMLSVADRIPEPLINAIGAAPSVGRDRWLKLADLLEKSNLDTAVTAALGDGSDDRFDAVLTALTPARPPAPPPQKSALTGAGGQALGEVKRGKGKTTLTLNAQTSEGFEEWLVDNISELHTQWQFERKNSTG